MSLHRLPTTSYGYSPPPDARADGWRCFGRDCYNGGSPAPRRWPVRCPDCGTPVDPTFPPPWDHDAKGALLAHQLRSAVDAAERANARLELCGWQYTDALRNNDVARQRAAGARFRHEVGQLGAGLGAWTTWRTLGSTLVVAITAPDLDLAADLIMTWHPSVRTDDVDNNNENRTHARWFVATCVEFLEQQGSIGHAGESSVLRAMWDVAHKVWDILNRDQLEGIERIRRIRATVAEAARIDRRDQARVNTMALHTPLPHPGSRDWAVGRPPEPVRRRLMAVAEVLTDTWSGRADGDLAAAFSMAANTLSRSAEREDDDPSVLWSAVLIVNAALLLADVHDDPTGLFAAADLLAAGRGTHHVRAVTTGMAHLLRAHGHTALMDDHTGADRAHHARLAEAELTLAERTATGPVVPAVRALRGLFTVQLAKDQSAANLAAAIDHGIETCREGRIAASRTWRKPGGTDIALARLLVWRARLVDECQEERLAAAMEAERLVLRWCRPGRGGPLSAEVVRNEALRAQDTITGRGDLRQRAANWRTAAARAADAPAVPRMRLAVAWVAWAVESGDPALACDAYAHLMPLIPLDVSARYRPEARQKALSAAQEHTEEAGYWLARAGRYREAAVAMETGRAISLSYLASWDNADIAERLARAGRVDLVAEYRAALAALAEQERMPGTAGPGSPLRAAWAHARAVAASIAEVTGSHPLASTIDYADITRVNDEGAVIYLAAAKAAGYALVIAGGHDPQYIHLPGFNRDEVMTQMGAMLPGRGQPSLSIPAGLRWLAESGLRDILLFHARGRIVTLVPVGLLSLLPLHAAVNEHGHHVGQYSAIRYAPNIRTLLRCRDAVSAQSTRPHRLLAVNVPVGHGERRRLEHVATETAEVCRIWRGHRGDGHVVDDCTWAEFQRTADDYSVWHIACHGAAAPLQPEESRVSFADTTVTLHQLATQLRAGPRRLAVLSACESHLTGAALPNEVVGLPTVLLGLGFAGVIATGWRIGDEAATYLMARFYRLWTGGEAHPAIALNAAQKWLRTATKEDLAKLVPEMPPIVSDPDPPFAQPYHWAAFAYTGA